MKLGITVRNMGPQSTPELMCAATQMAEQAGIESVWITDHIAIPPDDAEGSGGRYTDPLTTLAWLGAKTSSIRLGTGVLILPYRRALPTAKSIATVAEFTGGRLLLGIGVGWMDPEFQALGVDRHARGKTTDATLDLIRRCFTDEVVTENGQPFLFDPKPAMPPTYIGGAAPHALQRAVRHGCGWLPMVRSADVLAPQIQQFDEIAVASGRAAGPVTAMAGVDCRDTGKGAEALNAYADCGIERIVCALRYDTLSEFEQRLQALLAAQAAR